MQDAQIVECAQFRAQATSDSLQTLEFICDRISNAGLQLQSCIDRSLKAVELLDLCGKCVNRLGRFSSCLIILKEAWDEVKR